MSGSAVHLIRKNVHDPDLLGPGWASETQGVCLWPLRNGLACVCGSPGGRWASLSLWSRAKPSAWPAVAGITLVEGRRERELGRVLDAQSLQFAFSLLQGTAGFAFVLHLSSVVLRKIVRKLRCFGDLNTSKVHFFLVNVTKYFKESSE